jgi:zinc protease
MMKIANSIFLFCISVALVGCGGEIKSTAATTDIEKKEVIKNNFPIPEVWKTPEGLTVWFLYDSSIPVVDLRLTFKGGSAQHSPVEGLASVTNQLIKHGTKEMDEEQLSLRLDSLGIDLSLSSWRDMAVVSMRTLSGETFEKGVETLSQLIVQPAFPEAGMQRVIANRRVSLRRNKTLPKNIVSNAFWEALYQKHPYSQRVGGSIESLEKITRKEIQKYYQKYYVASNGVLVIVGKLNRSDAESTAALISRSLPEKKEKLISLPQAKTLPKSQRLHLDTNSHQTHIRIGQLAINRSHPDYAALYVANQILGGGALNSVLGDVIREKRGWAYSVGSYMQPMLGGGPWIIYMQTANETAQAAIDETMKVVQGFDSYLTDKRIEESIQYLRGNFALTIDSNKKLLGYFSMMGFYDLPADYLNIVDKKFQQVTPQKVREAWKKHFKADNLLIVSAGKKVKQSKDKKIVGKQKKRRH